MFKRKDFYLFLISSLLFLVAIADKDHAIDLKSPISVSETKGCGYPVREVRVVKTEMRHILPYTLIHKCHYDGRLRLIKVSTYNFEVGFQSKKPTHEVLFHWAGHRLKKISKRLATHGSGEVDIESVYLVR